MLGLVVVFSFILIGFIGRFLFRFIGRRDLIFYFFRFIRKMKVGYSMRAMVVDSFRLLFSLYVLVGLSVYLVSFSFFRVYFIIWGDSRC